MQINLKRSELVQLLAAIDHSLQDHPQKESHPRQSLYTKLATKLNIQKEKDQARADRLEAKRLRELQERLPRVLTLMRLGRSPALAAKEARLTSLRYLLSSIGLNPYGRWSVQDVTEAIQTWRKKAVPASHPSPCGGGGRGHATAVDHCGVCDGEGEITKQPTT